MSKPKYKTMLKEIARQKGLKLKWVADQAGIEHTKFSRISNGKQLPDIQEGIRIAHALGVEPMELWPLPNKEEENK